MKSKVYFIDLRAGYKENLPQKIARLLKTAGILKIIKKRDLVAVKLHFGESGNTAFIRPVYIRKIVETLKGIGSIPFLTDCNTLYAGTRSDAPNHHATAISNGFAYSVINAPVIIADGLRGQSETCVTINQKNFNKVYIGSEIIHADSLLSAAHFKGHELSGFGGTIKNLGMGCASRRGKLAQHSTVAPKVKRKKCAGCGDCTDHCSQQAISLAKEKAVIDQKKCIGCGECIIICPNGAIQIQWNQDIPVFMENMVEYTMGVLQNKKDRALFINFITDVSPACDCMDHNDAPIVRDIGMVASNDPVAIDQASVDLVNSEQALPGSCLKTNIKSGEDKFRGIYPEVDWEIQLEYAEKVKLGSRNYELVSL
ncbi:MAG: DUF362 domain-containing protein [Desulfobacteraceae bacterium]|uniref:DUF362 domain-containing protein n=1 Tax=Candidatus Desulfaltia bathyphila TaxID=2841697 RepID=A0A8J6T6Q6_9BACT|nr:DUF362 domain-containing protein [Candidatus Desulfaltia bathyphila]MBL7194720.1 DUF362 domain-containing protein [Desulfobacterales bacterium]